MNETRGRIVHELDSILKYFGFFVLDSACEYMVQHSAAVAI
jgi:hypothetical protein